MAAAPITGNGSTGNMQATSDQTNRNSAAQAQMNLEQAQAEAEAKYVKKQGDTLTALAP
jgi:hypothetical protein